MIEISVLIVTKDRDKKLSRCLSSIQKNTYNRFEIVIVDESLNNKTRNLVKKLPQDKIKYLKLPSGGKAKGLNLGLSVCRGEIVAFTDDDCLVKTDWLESIADFFKKNDQVMGVFGQSLPYRQNGHKKEICLATFSCRQRKYFRDYRIIHYKELGLGNDMAFRREIFGKVGLFKEWLGPGVSGMAGGEEAELIYRVLKGGFLLAFDPKIVTYHNHWMNYEQEQITQGRYSIGALAFYGYYLTNDFKLFLAFIKNRIKERLVIKIKIIFGDLIRFKLRRLYRDRRELIYLIWEQLCFLKGFMIGTYHRLTI